MCICVSVCACHDMRMQVRGQLAGISSLLPPYELWGLNSGCQAWEQVPLLPELSQWHEGERERERLGMEPRALHNVGKCSIPVSPSGGL